MIDPGSVVSIDLPGVRDTKPRPCVVISTATHQTTQHDIVVAVLTGNLSQAKGPTDYILLDWVAAGLRKPTAFRAYLGTKPLNEIKAVFGKLSDRDWKEVQ